MDYFVSNIEPLMRFSAEDVVLDVGCGPGFLADRLAGTVREVHGVDISAYELDKARIRCAGRSSASFHQLDQHHYTELGALGERRFSVIIVMSVIQYYRSARDVEELIRQLRCYAAPSARLLIADIPHHANPIRETAGLLWNALRRRALWGTLRSLITWTFSDYSALRRKLGLLRFTPEELRGMLERLGLNGEVLRHRLTPLPGRLHLLVRFPGEDKGSP